MLVAKYQILELVSTAKSEEFMMRHQIDLLWAVVLPSVSEIEVQIPTNSK